MSFEDKHDASWVPEPTRKDLIATLAELLLDAVELQREGESDEPEDPR
jgi:hypothetical protein